MITLRGLSKEDFVLSQLFFIGEGDTVDSLQGIVGLVSKEVGCGALSKKVCQYISLIPKNVYVPL